MILHAIVPVIPNGVPNYIPRSTFDMRVQMGSPGRDGHQFASKKLFKNAKKN